MLWLALTGCLPTRIQLQYRRVAVQPVCPVCSDGIESILNALVDSSFAFQCWQIVLPGRTVGGTNNFVDLFIQVINENNQVKRAEIVVICWAIWRDRNEVV